MLRTEGRRTTTRRSIESVSVVSRAQSTLSRPTTATVAEPLLTRELVDKLPGRQSFTDAAAGVKDFARNATTREQRVALVSLMYTLKVALKSEFSNPKKFADTSRCAQLTLSQRKLVDRLMQQYPECSR